MPSFFIRLPRDRTGAIPQFSAVGRKPGSAPTPGAAPQERPFLQLFPSDAARERHHTVVPEHAAARDGADQLVQRMVPARVLPYGNETGVRLPKCRSMNRAGSAGRWSRRGASTPGIRHDLGRPEGAPRSRMRVSPHLERRFARLKRQRPWPVQSRPDGWRSSPSLASVAVQVPALQPSLWHGRVL